MGGAPAAAPRDAVLRRAGAAAGPGAVVRTVWIQRTGAAPYVQRHLPTGGIEIHFPIGGRPGLVGPLTARLTRDTGFAPACCVAEAVADHVAWRADNPR